MPSLGVIALWLYGQIGVTPRCPATPLAPRVAGSDSVYLPCQLDAEASVSPRSVTIQYPKLLEQSGIEGLARVQVIVTASGAVDSGSVTVTGSMHPGFEAAARAAVLGAAFTPGSRNGRSVASLVTMDFEFALGEALRSAAAAESARGLAARADTSVRARIEGLRRLAANLGGRVVRVYPFDAGWDAVRRRPVGGCGPYRVYVTPPVQAGVALSPERRKGMLAFAGSLARESGVPEAVRAAGWCLSRGL